MRKLSAVVAVTLLASLLSVAPAVLPHAPFTVRAAAAGCVDDDGNEVTCPISLKPSPLPIGRTIGEQELATAFGGSAQPFEWANNDLAGTGKCLPREAVCGLTKAMRVGSDELQDPAGELPDAASLGLAPDGDRAVTAADFNGDGRDETVVAARCPSGTGGTTSEICLAVFDPATNAYAPPGVLSWFRTGTYADTAGVGTLRLASGLILRTSASIVRATFELNTETDLNAGGVIATFTTAEPHGFVPGQPVRFGDDPDLAAALCPALETGASVLCGTDLSADWLPVMGTPSPSTFQLKIGVGGTVAGLANEDPSAPAGPIVPEPWPVLPTLGALDAPVSALATSFVVNGTAPPATPFQIFVDEEQLTVTGTHAPLDGSNAWTYTVARGVGGTRAASHAARSTVSLGCSTCRIGVTGIRTGVALAWDAPTHAASLAAYAVRPGRTKQFQKIDVSPVGKLATAACAAPFGDPCGTPVPDGGRDALDITAADFDGDGQDELAVAYAGSRASGAPFGMVRFFAVSEAKQLDPLSNPATWDAVRGGGPYAISISTGGLSQVPGSNLEGEDLVIAWGGTGHAFEVFDVSTSFQIRNVTLDNAALPPTLNADGDVVEWTPGETYRAGDIIRDALGFWRADRDGTAECQKDVGSAKRFYFPNPAGLPSVASSLPDLAFDPSWKPLAEEDVSTFNTEDATWPDLPGHDEGAVPRGLLDPAPPTASPAVARRVMVGAAVSEEVLAGTYYLAQGQFVSRPLAAQTIAGATFKMYMQAAREPASTLWSARPAVIVRLVHRDPGRPTETLYSSIGGPLVGSQYPAAFFDLTLTGNANADYVGFPQYLSRRFSQSDVTPLDEVEVDTGDHVVVEFGTRVDVSAPVPYVQVATLFGTGGGGGELPGNETTGGASYESATKTIKTPGNPFLALNVPLTFDDCGDHYADTGAIQWEPVVVPGAVDLHGDSTFARGSNVEVEVGDFDLNGRDDVVAAQTIPQQDPSVPGLNLASVPVNLQIWRSDDVSCSQPATPANAAACPSHGAPPVKSLYSRVLDESPGSAFATQTPLGTSLPSAQVSLAVGRLGAYTMSDTFGSNPSVPAPSFPNDVNADLVVSFVCSRTADGDCGGAPTVPAPGVAASSTGRGVAVLPFDVCAVGTDADGDGIDDVCPTPPDGSDVPWALSTLGGTYSLARPATATDNLSWSAAPIALPDVDHDAKTLGSPFEYLETGKVQPLLIVRSPPVHFDAIDEDGDGRIGRDEIYDVNNCFSDALAVAAYYTCETSSSYGTSVSVTSTMDGQVSASFTTGGAFGVDAHAGAGTLTGCERSGNEFGSENEEVADNLSVGGFCVEANAFFNMDWQESETSSLQRTIGRTFTYTSTVSTFAGSDVVYAAVQQSEVLEYPVYAGAGFGLGSGAPIEYVTTKTPLQTRFQWSPSDEYRIPLTAQGNLPQNVLSYASTEDQLESQVPRSNVASVRASPEFAGAIEVRLKDNHGMDCQPPKQNLVGEGGSDQPDDFISVEGSKAYWGSTRAISYKGVNEYPCSAGGVGYRLEGTKSALDRSYVATKILSGNTMVLQPTTPLPTGAAQTDWKDTAGSAFRTPGQFPVDEWTVHRFVRLDAEVVTNTESGFASSYQWNMAKNFSGGIGIGFELLGGIAAGFAFGGAGVSLSFSSAYTRDELQTLAIGTTQETRFTIAVDDNIKPDISYAIKPFLVQSGTGAMVLDWTTSVDRLDTFWHTAYYDRGPNPAFTLPNLLTPYKAWAPNSKPRVTAPRLLRSVADFATWDCEPVVDADTGLTSYTDCVPKAAADPKGLVLTTAIHNYSLRAYDSSTPLKVRFYVGDPARGGYAIPLVDAAGNRVFEASVPSVRSPQCVNRFCLPSQGEALVQAMFDWRTEMPGLLGRGVASDPLPIYAIIDPGNRLKPEVHDLVAPVEVRDCIATYPKEDTEFESLCPTTDNEAWFLQRFSGAPRTSTDLRVTSGDVAAAGAGAVNVKVHASKNTGRVQVRLFSCSPTAPSCLPQTNASPLGTQDLVGIPAGGSTSATFTGLPSGTRTLWVQVVALDNWEPPGGGPYDRTGSLVDNQVKKTLVIS